MLTNTGISQPVGLVFDSNNNFYVCNCGSSTIRKVTPAGTSTLFSSGSLFQYPNGITIDENDNLYASNFSNGNIIKITPTGTPSVLNVTPGGSTSGPSNGHLDYYQPTNTLYIASHGSNQIYKMELNNGNALTVIAGSGIRGNTDNTDALLATFSRPNGVVITSTGDSIYINSAIPVTNTPNNPLNPQVIRLITGVQSGTTSVSTLKSPSNNLKSYPNPVSDQLTIEFDLPFEYSGLTFKVFDSLGEIVFEKIGLKTIRKHINKTFDLSSLRSGHYTYSISSKNEILVDGLFIKK